MNPILSEMLLSNHKKSGNLTNIKMWLIMHKMEYFGVNKCMCIDLISSRSKINLLYQFLLLSRNSPVQSQWASSLKSGNDLSGGTTW